MKSRLKLTVLTFVLYYFISMFTEDSFFSYYFEGSCTVWDLVIEIALTMTLSFVFVNFSLFYSWLMLKSKRLVPKNRCHLFIYDILLLIFNNVTAYIVTAILMYAFDGTAMDFHQSLYVFSVLVTFISGIFTNTWYLERMALARTNLLKKQIDPHFMFNNFSILSELIAEEPKLAEKFLGQLSKVYRYVITNLECDVVSVSEEMAFLKSYIYLISIRYEDAVKVVLSPQMDSLRGNIPPASLQLLVENAIKHNRHSDGEPLTITVNVDGDWIVVENNLQPNFSEIPSTGIGIRNIANRYAALHTPAPTFGEENNNFIAKLPVIKS